jgi:alanine transaminase
LQEKNQVLGELALKARMTSETLNQIEGVTCNEVMGAMYAFPRIYLPDKAVQEAKVQIVVSLYYACFLTLINYLPSLLSRTSEI